MDARALNPPDSEVIKLEELRQAAFKAKWVIGIFVAACTLAAGVVSWVTPKAYIASTTLAPALTGSSSGGLDKLASFGSQFSGLASLAGFSLGSNSKEWESIAVLESENLTQRFIQNNNLLPVLFASKWNSATRSWKSTRPSDIPTLWKANQYFKKKIRKVNVDPKTGLITLSIKWRNPVQAADWANELVRMTNDYLRKQAIAESERSIAYLNSEAAKTSLVEARQAIFSVLQDEIDKAMLARGTKQYAFKILDPAFAPQKPSSLPFWAWMLIALVASSAIAIFGVFVRVAWNKT